MILLYGENVTVFNPVHALNVYWFIVVIFVANVKSTLTNDDHPLNAYWYIWTHALLVPLP